MMLLGTTASMPFGFGKAFLIPEMKANYPRDKAAEADLASFSIEAAADACLLASGGNAGVTMAADRRGGRSATPAAERDAAERRPVLESNEGGASCQTS